jgi:hypothetical protein
MATTFAIASLAIAMSTGMADAHWTGKGHMHIPGCSMGQPAGSICACGTAADHRPIMCRKGNGATRTKPARCKPACSVILT